MAVDAARAKSLFLAASDMPDLAQRADYLGRECGGDAELRARVEALLRANDAAPLPPIGAADATLTHGPDVQAETEDHVNDTNYVGLVLAGKYKLIEEIGEGGMGSVYMAQQTEPVKRAVAVKVIKAGMDSKAVLARFEAERQALAMMDHPNIAKVLDGGIVHEQAQGRTSLGFRPFFVMELVKGVPITQYCDERKLTPRERLELFVPVCQAIQHAHQKGVIHRDIKPSNVLVALYDDRPVPKVIDFGVAKAAGQALTDKTLMTGFGAVVGTPEYMSPEQASLNNLDIDTRSDVYSLGVLLYELLTGSTPVDKKSLGKAALLEILRIVREVEAPRPSAKLSTADELPSLSANRGTEPKRLTGLLRNELDWIVMKALEKDRSRRYETANGFAADVQRYLAGEPVQAVPPSAGYRLRTFVRKNRGPVIAGTAVMCALLLGITGTTLGLLRAEERRREAEQAKERERDRAEGERQAKEQEAEQRAKAEVEQRKAERQKELALQNLGAALDALLAATGPDVEKLIGSRTDLSANEREYLEAVARRWQDFARGRESSGETLLYLAEGHTYVARLWRRLGRLEEAAAGFESARDAYEKLTRIAGVIPETWKRLADTQNDLGLTLLDLGKPQEGWATLSAARDVRKRLAAEHPTVADYRRALAGSHINLGIQAAKSGRGREALTDFRKGCDLLAALVTEHPDDAGAAQDLIQARMNLGSLLNGLGEPAEAVRELTAARELCEQRRPAFASDQDLLPGIHLTLGDALRGLSRPAEARREFEAARDTLKDLVMQFPAIPRYRSQLADTANKLGLLLFDLGEREAAVAEHRTAREQREKLAAQFPHVPQYRIDLGGSYCNYGQELFNAGKRAESLEWLDKAVRTLTEVYEADPRDAMAKEFLRNSHQSRAITYDALGKYEKALPDWDKAVDLSHPSERNNYRLGRTGTRYHAGLLTEAVEDIAEIEKTEKLLPQYWFTFASVCAQASRKLAERKKENADLAMRLLTKAVAAGYKNRANIETNSDFDAVRGRDDFKKLLESLPKSP